MGEHPVTKAKELFLRIRTLIGLLVGPFAVFTVVVLDDWRDPLGSEKWLLYGAVGSVASLIYVGIIRVTARATLPFQPTGKLPMIAGVLFAPFVLGAAAISVSLTNDNSLYLRGRTYIAGYPTKLTAVSTQCFLFGTYAQAGAGRLKISGSNQLANIPDEISADWEAQKKTWQDKLTYKRSDPSCPEKSISGIVTFPNDMASALRMTVRLHMPVLYPTFSENRVTFINVTTMVSSVPIDIVVVPQRLLSTIRYRHARSMDLTFLFFLSVLCLCLSLFSAIWMQNMNDLWLKKPGR